MKPPTKYKIEQASDLPTPCWLWTGNVDFHGYGHTGRLTSETGRMKNWRVHRLMWTCIKGPIPTGMCLDHLCRNRHCLNPEHLECISSQENTRRGQVGRYQREKINCPQGHSYDEANTMWIDGKTGKPERKCRKCESNRYFKLKEQNPDRIREYQRRSDAKRSADPAERAYRAQKAREHRAKNVKRKITRLATLSNLLLRIP